MADGVEYRVSTIYEAKDNASRNLREIAGASKEAARNTGELMASLKGLAAAAVGLVGFGRAKAMLIDYNSSLEQSKTVLAGMLTLYTGQSIEKTWDRAATSVERFQDMAKKSALTTKELVETAQNLTRPLIQVGVKMSEIEKISFGVANAAKAFGMNGSTVAFDVEQAIGGRVTEKDRFIKSMLAQKSIGITDHEAFNKMDQGKRISILQKALTSPAISAMAEKQSGTLQGVMSTLEDNVSIAFGKIGLPLVKAITEEVSGWNNWIDANGGKLEEMGKSFSSALMTGFKTVKQVVSEIWPILQSVGGVLKDLMSFAANHKDTLIGLAKALIVMKVGEKLGGMAKGAVGGIGGFGGGIGQSFGMMKEGFNGLKSGTGGLTAAFSSLGSILGGAGGLIGAFAKLAGLGYTIGSLLLRDTEEEKKAKATANAQVLAAGEYMMQKNAIGSLSARFKTFGLDPDKDKLINAENIAEAEQLRQYKANIGMTEAKMLQEGIKAGMVRENIEKDANGKATGRRTLELYNKTVDPNGVKETIVGHAQLMSGLTVMFKEKALAAAYVGPDSIISSSGWDETMGKFYGGMRGGFLGFYKDTIGQKEEGYVDGQAKVPEIKQTVNITIQRVMAKDPNKWLADMDDMVQEKTRSKTRAKGSWRPSPR